MSRDRPREAFRFKRFSVQHNQSSMPVGTDAVLIATWTGIENVRNILDVGCGCGVISLILAQRSEARVIGIDIHGPSIEESKVNAASSPFDGRLEFIHNSLSDYSRMTGPAFDLIVSNPPYFSNSLPSPDSRRNLARHSETLSPKAFLEQALHLLLPEGRIALVLPWQTLVGLRMQALPGKLALTRLTRVIPREGSPPALALAEFAEDSLNPLHQTELALHNADGTVTEAFRKLTEAFYIS